MGMEEDGREVATLHRRNVLRIWINADGNKIMHPRKEFRKDGSLLEFVKCTGWNFAAIYHPRSLSMLAIG